MSSHICSNLGKIIIPYIFKEFNITSKNQKQEEM